MNQFNSCGFAVAILILPLAAAGQELASIDARFSGRVEVNLTFQAGGDFGQPTIDNKQNAPTQDASGPGELELHASFSGHIDLTASQGGVELQVNGTLQVNEGRISGRLTLSNVNGETTVEYRGSGGTVEFGPVNITLERSELEHGTRSADPAVRKAARNAFRASVGPKLCNGLPQSTRNRLTCRAATETTLYVTTTNAAAR